MEFLMQRYGGSIAAATSGGFGRKEPQIPSFTDKVKAARAGPSGSASIVARRSGADLRRAVAGIDEQASVGPVETMNTLSARSWHTRDSVRHSSVRSPFAAGATAAFFPARRAACIDPMTAMRNE